MTHLAHLIAHVPLAAASGEVETPEGNGTGSVGVQILEFGSILLGWVALFALWWFVFRDKSRSRRRKRSDPPAQGSAARAQRSDPPAQGSDPPA